MINYLKNGGKSILQMFDDLGQYCADTYNKVDTKLLQDKLERELKEAQDN